MSDSESASSRPSNAVLERTLKKETKQAMKDEDASINIIRTAVEKALGLEAGFFKGHGTWKHKSKIIINEEVESIQAAQASLPPVAKQSLPAKPKKKAGRPAKGKKRATSEESEDQPPTKKTKRKSKAPFLSESELSDPESVSSVEQKPKKPVPDAKAPTNVKGRKTKEPKVESETEEFDEKMEDEPSDEDNIAVPSQNRKVETDKVKDESEGSDDILEKEEASDEESMSKASKIKDEDPASESEMSVLIDEEPKKRGRRGKGSSGATAKSSKNTKPKKGRATKAKDADISPDEAEIKRLQSWLVKCGIRKLWGKELKPFETNKAKIRHLKGMLENAGMTGRYSQEKANQIKEARELAADIEAVQEGAERWGKDSESEGEGRGDGIPKRRLVQGRKNYDFLSSDGEETD